MRGHTLTAIVHTGFAGMGGVFRQENTPYGFAARDGQRPDRQIRQEESVGRGILPLPNLVLSHWLSANKMHSKNSRPLETGLIL